MRYNKVFMPHTYRDLVEAEFTDDYSLGYTHHLGFRASTSIPFPFYDINLEIQQPIKIHPFAICDYSLRKFKSIGEVHSKLDAMYQNTKKVKGNLAMVFSNELLGGKHKMGWLQLYESLLKRYYV